MSPIFAAYTDLPRLVQINEKYASRMGGGSLPPFFLKKMISKLDIGIKIFEDGAFYIYRMKKDRIHILRMLIANNTLVKPIFIDVLKMVLSSGRHTVIINVPPIDIELCGVLKNRDWYAYTENSSYIKFRYNYSSISAKELEQWWIL